MAADDFVRPADIDGAHARRLRRLRIDTRGGHGWSHTRNAGTRPLGMLFHRSFRAHVHHGGRVGEAPHQHHPEHGRGQRPRPHRVPMQRQRLEADVGERNRRQGAVVAAGAGGGWVGVRREHQVLRGLDELHRGKVGDDGRAAPRVSVIPERPDACRDEEPGRPKGQGDLQGPAHGSWVIRGARREDRRV